MIMLTNAGDDDACRLAVRAECTLNRADVAHVALCHSKVGRNGRLRDTFGEEKLSQFKWGTCRCQARVSRVLSNGQERVPKTYVQCRSSQRSTREPKLLRCILLLEFTVCPGMAVAYSVED